MGFPEPGTKEKFAGAKIQYNYYYYDPERWWPRVLERLRPSVFLWDMTGDYYDTGPTRNFKWDIFIKWGKKIAQYARENGVYTMFATATAGRDDVGLAQVAVDMGDYIDAISPARIDWFGLGIEWSVPRPGEDVGSALQAMNDACAARGVRFYVLEAVMKEWWRPHKDRWPVITGTNWPAPGGEPSEIGWVDGYRYGFGVKLGWYRRGMEDDWNDARVVECFNQADQAAKIGVLLPNILSELVEKDDFAIPWVREATARGYRLAPIRKHRLSITSSPMNVRFTIDGSEQTTPYSEELWEGEHIIQVPEEWESP